MRITRRDVSGTASLFSLSTCVPATGIDARNVLDEIKETSPFPLQRPVASNQALASAAPMKGNDQ
jgi:hypothetical protein